MQQTVSEEVNRKLPSKNTIKWLTVGSRAFPLAGPKTWNSLLAQSEYTFRRQLKTCFFQQVLFFCLDVIIWYWLHLDF